MIRDAALADAWKVVKEIVDKLKHELLYLFEDDSLPVGIILRVERDLIHASYLQRTHHSGELQDVVEYPEGFSED